MLQTVPANIVPLPVPTPSPKFIPPSIQQAMLHGIKIGLPDTEVEKFLAHYGSNGWKVGKNKMQSWPHAMAGWKCRWEERRQEKQQRVAEPTASVKVISWQSELKRVETKMASIRGSYSEHQGWSVADKNLFGCLKKRRDELVNKLGMIL